MRQIDPEEVAKTLDRLSWQANAAAQQVRAGNIRDIVKFSFATADLRSPDFTHMTIGDFHIHVSPPKEMPIIDVEATLMPAENSSTVPVECPTKSNEFVKPSTTSPPSPSPQANQSPEEKAPGPLAATSAATSGLATS